MKADKEVGAALTLMNDNANAPIASYLYIFYFYRRWRLQPKKENQVRPWLMKMVCVKLLRFTWMFKESVPEVALDFLIVRHLTDWLITIPA